MAYGITAAGFVRKPYTVILEEVRASIRTNVSSDIDLSTTQTDGQWAIVQAKALDEIWQLAENTYYSVWLGSADGVSLDYVGGLKGQTRRDETKAVVDLDFAGDPSTTIPAGTIVATEQNVQFETLTEVTTDGSGDASVQAQASDAGFAGLVPAESITVIVSSVPGVDTVTNAEASTGGADIEGDPDYRSRMGESEAVAGSSDFGIQALIAELPGVSVARVYTNRTLAESVAGIPAKSIEAIVEGGVVTDIAQTIYRAAPAEVNFYGDITEAIVDDGGESHDIKFSRPSDVDIYVIINITKNTKWVSGQETKVKTAVIKTIGGTDTIVSTTTEYIGLGIGESVRTWEITGNLDEEGIVGIDAVEVLVGKTASPAPSEDTLLSIAARERARTDNAKITVNVS